METIPPRLHVVMASEARYAVVFRRGPTEQVATFGWDMARDEFTLGQWFKGRIYERRSDLSPDGLHLLYFAAKHRGDPYSWTAISRAPYLKAIGFFPKGDSWNGGGLWTGRSTYWLNDGPAPHEIEREPGVVARDLSAAYDDRYGSECRGVYYNRLMRDGWVRAKEVQPSKWSSVDVFVKEVNKHWTLCKLAHSQINSPVGKGCYWDEHILVNSDGETEIPCPDWEWAEVDRKRLVWAADGRIWAGRVQSHGLADVEELFDFRGMRFKAVEPPYCV